MNSFWKEYIKDVKTSITWRKPFYKRIFCSHNFIKYKVGEFHALNNSVIMATICEKCGKLKTIYSDYDNNIRYTDY